ncbi:hypothetical protein [Brevundimonas bullata]|uniref:hypothetical protein n=1 Tax=Brevundimonas bullata TaxID=13160 RepID=UPI003D9A8565
MRRPPITAILTAGACALGVAAPAAAQESAGQRYLAWPTKTAAASGPAAYVANPAASPVPGAPRRRAPIIPHGGFGRMPDTAPAQNLTPASAWLGPNAPTYQPVPPPQPYPAPTPPPTSWSRDLTPPAPAPGPAPRPAYAAATPTRAAPQPQPQPQPVYAPAPPVAAPTPAPVYVAPAYAAPAETTPAPQPPVAYAPPPVTEAAPIARPTAPPAYSATSPAPTPVVAAPQPVPVPASEPAPVAPPAPDAPAFDPMAPRRDAPIFRLQRAAPSEPVAAPSAPSPATTAPQPQAQSQAQPQPLQAAPQEGARYYSVHRQAGRQPDATPLPPAVYLDGLPVELTTPPASTDLAEPPAQPALIRNSNGRLQAAPDTEVQDQP